MPTAIPMFSGSGNTKLTSGNTVQYLGMLKIKDGGHQPEVDMTKLISQLLSTIATKLKLVYTYVFGVGLYD